MLSSLYQIANTEMEVRRRNVESSQEPEKRDFYETIKTFDAFTKVKEEAVVESGDESFFDQV